MTITKYKACTIGPKIEQAEVISETAAFVTVRGRHVHGHTYREKKVTAWYGYFDSFDDAKQWLMHIAEMRVKTARRSLEQANSFHGNIKGMKEPK